MKPIHTARHAAANRRCRSAFSLKTRPQACSNESSGGSGFGKSLTINCGSRPPRSLFCPFFRVRFPALSFARAFPPFLSRALSRPFFGARFPALFARVLSSLSARSRLEERGRRRAARKVFVEESRDVDHARAVLRDRIEHESRWLGYRRLEGREREREIHVINHSREETKRFEGSYNDEEGK
eukprot:309239-Pleurochrysis_carterae.AAC.4